MSAAEPARRPWSGRRAPDPVALGVGAVLAAALGLRLWGVRHGLPFSYNADEDAHFVPQAVGLFGHGWNPGYFVNPPAYTYLLHLLLAVAYGGRDAVGHAYAAHLGDVFTLARIAAGALCTVAVGLLYLAGARMLGRPAGLLAAAVLAVAFLPVFYSHLALNDVPVLAGVSLSLWGTARVLDRGRPGDFALAGIGVGLAAATKYTGGIVVLPLLGAAALRARHGARPALRGTALALAAAALAFAVADPYAVLDPGAFHAGLSTQASAAAGGQQGKLGLTERSGIAYYLWTFTWGLGWVPSLAALAGAALLAARRRALALVLVPAPIAFVLFMGTQERYFGRWLMPVLPIACLLAAHAGAMGVGAVRARARRAAPAAAALAAAALLAQGAWTSVRGDLVLSRADTRNLARAWMVAHVPAGSKVVIEPVVPNTWLQDPGRVVAATGNGSRWIKFLTLRSSVALGHGQRTAGNGVRLEDYERTTRPALVGAYERGGYCWVLIGSTQYGRALVQPRAVPAAIAYYRLLARRGSVVYHVSPYRRGARPVAFNFDWSFDYYPAAYERPGPEITVYRLRSCPAPGRRATPAALAAGARRSRHRPPGPRRAGPPPAARRARAA